MVGWKLSWKEEYYSQSIWNNSCKFLMICWVISWKTNDIYDLLKKPVYGENVGEKISDSFWTTHSYTHIFS